MLLGNYPGDQQISMQRYHQLLERALIERGWEVRLIRPAVCIKLFKTRHQGLGKWIGYLDKFVIFPFFLLSTIKRLHDRRLIVHICDHSNAPYLFFLSKCDKVITCHDVIALRMARGEFSGQKPGPSGRLLQRWIHKGLSRADFIFCVSKQTRDELRTLLTIPDSKVPVAYQALNYPYKPLAQSQAVVRLEQARQTNLLSQTFPMHLLQGQFLLHVGSDVWYKNRIGLLNIYRGLTEKERLCPPLLLVGPPLGENERHFLRQHDIESHVFCTGYLDAYLLNAIYALATLMVFPSLAEGFGWPVLEAMACGCPVVTSNRAPMTEVGGSAAEYFDPDQPVHAAEVVKAVLKEDDSQRRERVRACIKQAATFSIERMVRVYEETYMAFGK